MSRQNIPLRFQARCAYCAGLIDTEEPGNYSLQMGWMKNRTEGGGNALALRQPVFPLAFSCGDCIDRLRHGQSTSQATLFG
jgi:hypothetical protein